MRYILLTAAFALLLTVPFDFATSQTKKRGSTGSAGKVRKNSKGEFVANPNKTVAQILRKLGQSVRINIEKEQQVSLSALLSQEELNTLNRFAAGVAGVSECKVLSIEGCHSCYNGDTCRICGGRGGEPHYCGYENWGNYVHTTCGRQCWSCAFEKCTQ